MFQNESKFFELYILINSHIAICNTYGMPLVITMVWLAFHKIYYGNKFHLDN